MTRFVVDASALLSGIVSAGDRPPGRLLVAARAGSFEAVACPHLLDEVRRGASLGVLQRRASGAGER